MKGLNFIELHQCETSENSKLASVICVLLQNYKFPHEGASAHKAHKLLPPGKGDGNGSL